MIQVHRDALGNITGYFDTERSQWVPPPQPIDMEVEVEDDGQAADEDDAGEPAFEDMTKAQLADWLTSAGVEVSPKDTKSELLDQAKDVFASQQDDTL